MYDMTDRKKKIKKVVAPGIEPGTISELVQLL